MCLFQISHLKRSKALANSFFKCLKWVIVSGKVLQVDSTTVTQIQTFPEWLRSDALALQAHTGGCASSFSAIIQLTSRFSIVQSLKIQKKYNPLVFLDINNDEIKQLRPLFSG